MPHCIPAKCAEAGIGREVQCAHATNSWPDNKRLGDSMAPTVGTCVVPAVAWNTETTKFDEWSEQQPQTSVHDAACHKMDKDTDSSAVHVLAQTSDKAISNQFSPLLSRPTNSAATDELQNLGFNGSHVCHNQSLDESQNSPNVERKSPLCPGKPALENTQETPPANEAQLAQENALETSQTSRFSLVDGAAVNDDLCLQDGGVNSKGSVAGIPLARHAHACHGADGAQSNSSMLNGSSSASELGNVKDAHPAAQTDEEVWQVQNPSMVQMHEVPKDELGDSCVMEQAPGTQPSLVQDNLIMSPNLGSGITTREGTHDGSRRDQPAAILDYKEICRSPNLDQGPKDLVHSPDRGTSSDASSALVTQTGGAQENAPQPAPHMLELTASPCEASGLFPQRTDHVYIDGTVDHVTRHLLHARKKIEAAEREFEQIMGDLVAYKAFATNEHHVED